jgi:thiol-disulfide isomerase/thioredoxin
MNKGLLIATGLLLVAAIYLAFVPLPVHPLVGKMAPDLELKLLDGDTFRLSDHRGSDIVVLDFWTTWCGPCLVTMPILEQIAREYEEKGVRFYTVNMAENPANVRAFMRDIGVELRVALDPGFQVGRVYKVGPIPQTVLIDKDGLVQAVYVGVSHNSSDELRAELDTLLAGGRLVEKAAS